MSTACWQLLQITKKMQQKSSARARKFGWVETKKKIKQKYIQKYIYKYMYTYKMYMTWQEKTKKWQCEEKQMLWVHAQIKTSTERKLFGKKPFARISPLFVPLYPQTPFVLWYRGNCLHKKVSATLYVFDILNGPVATCQSLFKFAFHKFPSFLLALFWFAVHSLALCVCACVWNDFYFSPAAAIASLSFSSSLWHFCWQMAFRNAALGKVSLKVCK